LALDFGRLAWLVVDTMIGGPWIRHRLGERAGVGAAPPSQLRPYRKFCQEHCHQERTTVRNPGGLSTFVIATPEEVAPMIRGLSQRAIVQQIGC